MDKAIYSDIESLPCLKGALQRNIKKDVYPRIHALFTL